MEATTIELVGSFADVVTALCAGGMFILGFREFGKWRTERRAQTWDEAGKAIIQAAVKFQMEYGRALVGAPIAVYRHDTLGSENARSVEDWSILQSELQAADGPFFELQAIIAIGEAVLKKDYSKFKTEIEDSRFAIVEYSNRLRDILLENATGGESDLTRYQEALKMVSTLTRDMGNSVQTLIDEVKEHLF